MKKVGIIIGHSSRSQGARAYNGDSEYQFNTIVSEFMEKLYEYKRPFDDSYRMVFLNRNQGWDNLVSDVRGLKLDATIELHFNSFRKVAYGVECLSIAETAGGGGYALADFMSDEISQHYHNKQRSGAGVKELFRGDRGSYNLRCMAEAGVAESIIVEPCFANFETEESKKIIGNPLEYANVLYKAIEGFYGGSDGDS